MQVRYFVVGPSSIVSGTSDVSDAWSSARSSGGVAYEAHLIIDFRGPEATIYSSPAELLGLHERLLDDLREGLKVAEGRVKEMEQELGELLEDRRVLALKVGRECSDHTASYQALGGEQAASLANERVDKALARAVAHHAKAGNLPS